MSDGRRCLWGLLEVATRNEIGPMCGHTWEPEFFEIVFSQRGNEAHDLFCGPAAFGLEIATSLGVVGLCVVDLLYSTGE